MARRSSATAGIFHQRIEVADFRHVLGLLQARQESRARQVPRDAGGKQAVAAALALRTELINAERQYIYRLPQQGEITDEARRRIELELDLEEATIMLKRQDEEDPPV